MTQSHELRGQGLLNLSDVRVEASTIGHRIVVGTRENLNLACVDRPVDELLTGSVLGYGEHPMNE